MPYGFMNLLRALAGLLGASWLGASDTVGRDHSSLRLPLGGMQLLGLACASPGPVGWLLTKPPRRGTRGLGLACLGWRPRGGSRPVTHAWV